MKNKIPSNVKIIMKKFIENGHECFLVGGCVRDMLLGLAPKDYDLCTNAIPEQVEKIFHKTIPTGKDYGTITVMIDNEGYEVTTYRLECDYDGRRPKVVKFSNILKEDLSRRDFTINSMVMDIKGNVIDYFGGEEDLHRKEIKCVGDAAQRFKEDKLRILRAFRFASRYNFTISDEIYNAILIDNNISNLSKERLREELNKIIVSEKPSVWLIKMKHFGLLEQIIPNISKCYDFDQHNPNHNKDVFKHILSVIDNIQPKLELRLAALFHDIGKPNVFTIDENGIGHFYSHHKESSRICRKIMIDLRYSNKEIEYVSELVYYHMTRYEKLRSSSVKKFINKVGIDKLEDIFKLFIADRVSTKPPYDFEEIYRLKFECEKVLSEKQPLNIKDLDITGRDLINLGVPQGKDIGIILNKLLEKVLDNPKLNKKEYLLDEVKSLFK
ncbi:CCA tRNA nucleotidyltransferase [Anaerophilus nitritogenes]|uniref:CCA tRNA nucleotidyltransferase n=1 Tax=Anaerophilus nitritogenes TaxID=2498136 RepID=UPI00101CF07E|nr:CCA tRNA nucleotidyltransferase [Anaerophilus nitritogenes]